MQLTPGLSGRARLAVAGRLPCFKHSITHTQHGGIMFQGMHADVCNTQHVSSTLMKCPVMNSDENQMCASCKVLNVL